MASLPFGVDQLIDRGDFMADFDVPQEFLTMRDTILSSQDGTPISKADDTSRTYSPVDRYAGLNSSAMEITDCLGGVEAIVKFLGWSIRKVRYARETGALPIRVKAGVGLYAFKSEIVAALKTPDTLVPKAPDKVH